MLPSPASRHAKMIRVYAIASDGRRNRGFNNTLISQLVEMVAQKINVEQGQEKQDKSEPPDDAALTLANLTRVSPDVWKELPKDVQEVIIKACVEESKAKKEADKSKDGKPKTKGGLPRQYTKINMTTTSPNEDMVEEYLQQALNQDKEEDDLLANVFCARTDEVSVSEERVISCMNSMAIEANKKLVILDDGANMAVIGNGWEVIAKHPTRKARDIGFDHKAAVKRNLDIVSTCTVVEINDEPIFFQINETVCKQAAQYSLLSEYQLRGFDVKVNSVARKHGGEQNVIVGDQEVPCGVKNCLIYFKCQLPTDEDWKS